MWLEGLVGEAETTEADPGHIVEGLCALVSLEDLIFRQQGLREWLSRSWCHIAEATAISLLEASPKNLFSQPRLPSPASWAPASHGGPCIESQAVG